MASKRIKEIIVIITFLFAHLVCFAQENADIFDLGDPVFQSVIPNERAEYYKAIAAIAQDLDGFIWVATQSGISRYDGYDFKVYRHDQNDPNSLAGDLVRAMVVDKNNNIWVGSEGVGLSILNIEKDHFVRPVLVESDVFINVRSMVESPGVGMWVGTTNGLYLLDYDFTLLEHYQHDASIDNGLAHNKIYSLFLDEQQTLWIGTEVGLQKKSLRGEFETLSLNDKKDIVYSVFIDSMGHVWAGTTTQGLYRSDLDQNLFTHVTSTKDATDVRAIIEPESGSIWAGTKGRGLYVLDATTMEVTQHYVRDAELPYSIGTDLIQSMFVDAAGLIWIGTWGDGIKRFNPHNRAIRQLYATSKNPHSLSNANVVAKKELANGLILLAPYGKGLDVFSPSKGRIKTFNDESTPLLNKAKVRSIEQTKDGQVWLAIRGVGLVHYEYNTDVFTLVPAFEGYEVDQLKAEPSGNLLVSTDKGLVRFFPENLSIQRLNRADLAEQDSTKYRLLNLASDGRIWFVSGSVLYFIEPNASQINKVNIEHELHLAGHRIHGLNIETDHGFLVATKNNVFRLVDLQQKGNEYSVKGERSSLKFAISGKWYQGKNGDYWSGSSLVNLDKGTSRSLTVVDGLGVSPLWLISRNITSLGTIMIGGVNGVVMVKPERFIPWDYQPPVVISEMYVNNQSVNSHQQTLNIQPEDTSLSLSFAALDYTDPNKNRYRYQLKGYAKDTWSEVDYKRRSATFTNLNPGTYEFVVEGTNRLDQWSNKQAALTIIVHPAWFQTWWFRSVIMLCIATLLYGMYYMRVRQLQAKRKELEVIVAERTHSLEEKSQALVVKSEALEAQTVELKQKSRSLEVKTHEATQALQQLVATQGQLVESEKHASLGRLVVGVSHELNTPLGIAKVAVDQMLHDAQALSDMMSSGKLSKAVFIKKNQSISDASDMASTSINRAADLVARFKALSTEQTKAEKKDVELAQHLHDIVSAIEFGTSSMKGRLHVYADQQVILHTDPDAFRKIIDSLFDNTMQHAFFDSIELARIEIRLNKEIDEGDETIVLTFTDNGCGIHQDELPHIFDPFYTSARDAGAVGLGLHMVFNIVTRTLMGTIECVSTIDKGTQFIICMPVNPQVQVLIEHDDKTNNDNVLF